MGWDRCKIIEYSGLSEGKYTDLSSYRHFVCYCSYTWAVQLIRGVFHLDTSLVCWFRVISVLFFVFSGVFIPEEVDGVADKKSGDTTMVDMQTLLKAFLNMSPRSACFIHEVFLFLKQNFRSWDYPPQVPHYQMSD
jgi:hypothetical protein